MLQEISLRQKLIQATEEILLTTDIDHLSLREVAKRCNISHNTPYRHFKDKEELIAAVATRGFDNLCLEIELARSRHQDALEATVEGYLEFSRKFPSKVRIMFGPCIVDFATYPDLLEASNRALALLFQGAQISDPRQSSSKQTRSAIAMWACIHGLADLRLNKSLNFLAVEDQPTNHDLSIVLRAGIQALNEA